MSHPIRKVFGKRHPVPTDQTVSKKKSAAASHKGFDLAAEKLFGDMDRALRKVTHGREAYQKMLNKALEDAPEITRVDGRPFGAARFGAQFPEIRLGRGKIDLDGRPDVRRKLEKKVTFFSYRERIERPRVVVEYRLNEIASRLKHSYLSMLISKPDLAGSIPVKIAISPDGTVASCEIGRENGMPRELTDRVCQSIKNIRFKPATEIQYVQAKFVFLPFECFARVDSARSYE